MSPPASLLCLQDARPCVLCLCVQRVCVCACASVCVLNPIGVCIRVWPSLAAIVVPALCLLAAVSVCVCVIHMHVEVCVSMFTVGERARRLYLCVCDCVRLRPAKNQLLSVSVHCVQSCV